MLEVSSKSESGSEKNLTYLAGFGLSEWNFFIVVGNAGIENISLLSFLNSGVCLLTGSSISSPFRVLRF